MRFAGQAVRYRNPRSDEATYRAQRGDYPGYAATRGDSGMSSFRNEYQAPRVESIALTQMPSAQEPEFNWPSMAEPPFKARVRA